MATRLHPVGLVLALATTMLLGLAAAPSAAASPRVQFGLTDDAWLLD